MIYNVVLVISGERSGGLGVQHALSTTENIFLEQKSQISTITTILTHVKFFFLLYRFSSVNNGLCVFYTLKCVIFSLESTELAVGSAPTYRGSLQRSWLD